MASNPEQVRLTVLMKLQEALDEETILEEQILALMHRFADRLSLDRLPHRLNLSSRGMDIPAISCPSCNANVESANHFFFECDIATDMWKLVFRWCDIPLFQASSWDSFNDWIISWHASKEKNTGSMLLLLRFFGGFGDTEIASRLTLNH
ncbi:RNA-directed DNA polymerase, eukaryota [Tanacetum coccineum]